MAALTVRCWHRKSGDTFEDGEDIAATDLHEAAELFARRRGLADATVDLYCDAYDHACATVRDGACVAVGDAA